MRTSINLLCVAGLIEQSHLPILEMAASYGYDGVEIPIINGDPDHYKWLGNTLDGLGLARTSTSIIPCADQNPISSDAESRARGREHLDWVMACAEALGSESVGGPIYSPIGHFTGVGPTADELAWGAEAHHAMAERAQAAGIFLSVEPLNRFETYFLNTAAQAKSYVDSVSHPAMRLIYDTFHGHIEEKDQAAAVATVAGHIGVLHVSENDRGIPGTGQIDFPEIFQAVRRTGFDGWIITEAFANSVPELAAATRVWRPLFPDLDTLFRDSIQTMRSAWEGADRSGRVAE